MKVPGAGDPLQAGLRIMAARNEPMASRPGGVERPDLGTAAGVDPRLREATVALEGVFARELVRALRGTVPEGGSPDAPGGELYTSLFDDHLADVLAGDDGLGLSTAMLKQLLGAVDAEPGGS